MASATCGVVRSARVLRLGFFMSRGSVSFSVFACVLLSLWVAGTGHAQARASRRHEPVALRLQVSEPGTNVSVETADRHLGPKGRLVLQCSTVCDTEVPGGIYKLVLKRDGEASALDSEVVSLRRPLQYTTESASPGLRVLGGGLFITGGVAVVGGFIATFPMLMSSMCHGGGNTCDRHITLGRIGFIAAGSGGVMVLVGMLLYWSNHTSFKAERLKVREPGLSMQVLPGRSGITGVVTGRF
jgi:hypothetical protein